jgi:hypothetical protein
MGRQAYGGPAGVIGQPVQAQIQPAVMPPVYGGGSPPFVPPRQGFPQMPPQAQGFPQQGWAQQRFQQALGRPFQQLQGMQSFPGFGGPPQWRGLPTNAQGFLQQLMSMLGGQRQVM